MKSKTLILGLGIVVLGGALAYFGTEIKDSLAPTPSHTPVTYTPPKSDGSVPANGWLSYQAPNGLFSMLYPTNYSKQDLPGGVTAFGRTVNWFQLRDPLYICKSPDCPTLKRTETVAVNGVQAKKYWGEYTDESTRVTQSFIQYEVPLPSGQYLSLRMSELPLDLGDSLLELYPDHKPGVIESKREEILNTMAQSIRF